MKSTVLACVGLVATAGFAADFVWQGNDSSSWMNPGSYKDVNGSVFSGGGMVTNANTTSQMLSFNYACGTFTGTICGNIQFRPIYRSDTWINLMSDASTYADTTIVYGGGRLGLMKFGRTGGPFCLRTRGRRAR